MEENQQNTGLKWQKFDPKQQKLIPAEIKSIKVFQV